MRSEEIVFCTDLTDEPEEYRRTRIYYPTVFDESEEVLIQYGEFVHEAEVLIYALADAVENGKISADEAREMFESYRKHMPELYDPVEIEEYENSFPTVDHFMDWSTGPGTSGFWQDAEECGVEGVYFNEGEHPGGGPVFYIHRKEALKELREGLAGRYKIVVRRDRGEYESSNSDEARRTIEQTRRESNPL